jgi:hypothetical protein
MTILDQAADTARAILAKRDPHGSVPLDHGFVAIVAAEAYTVGVIEGIARSQAAVSQVHAKVRFDLE